MKFCERIAPLIADLGTARAAEICGVGRRTMQLWLQGGGNPNRATQTGVIVLLEKERSRTAFKHVRPIPRPV